MTTSASACLDKIGVCYEEMAAMIAALKNELGRGKLMYEMERADSKGKPVRRWVIESALDSTERARVRLWEEQQGMSDNDISMVCTLFGVDDIGMIPWHDGLSV